ncbi:hypothetical protein A1Q2_02539 [Trichosporon asahii var. asahii CBS 8904]|uniref:Calcineurin-like phosphoesterase domain-containing protein n=2 Tax=Trichosporon asahii var. asahii TaxID=189963 RepID=K1VG87_TRIAC|nr:Icc family phosphohydrolase [Trichosporon asahii var. asahii CBS 2479]EJT51440.1 Icc family phosphohydrolase [Trichosporon asahii var. asahii CBS 2479]EKD03090.1 hypothetical protein A1Q2_02539 [Trichosporon asahii var. asahii CBS 8904]
MQLTGPKPAAWAGQVADLTLVGDIPLANITYAGNHINATSSKNSDGTTTVHIPTSLVNATTVQQVDINLGDSTYSVNMTVFPAATPQKLPEDPVWIEMFESAATGWTSSGWDFDTLDGIVEHNGTEGKQRFSRASGVVAHAQGPGRLTSPPVNLPLGRDYELRFSSHFSGSDAAVSVTFDNSTTVHRMNATESGQVRIPFTPSGPASFAFELKEGSYWLIDDVAVVRPLGNSTGPILETIDIISDIQNIPCNKWMHDSLLPGLAQIGPRATTLVINGDLVGWDGEDSWSSFSKALKPAKSYNHVISTAGNHEMFGKADEETKKRRFLAYTGMGARHNAAQEAGANGVGTIGGAGLWGEHVTASGVPLLWLASERWWQDPSSEPQYVVLSDEQFGFLARRLEYWRARSRTVLLFSHHPLPFSVSGTWTPFESRNFGTDELRFRHLLAANPHAVLVTSHSHWAIEAADQNVDHRPLVGWNSTTPTFNTGATINWYDLGDKEWQGVWKGEKAPTAIRVEVYADRVRFKALRFWNLSTTATVVNTRDVAFPAQGRLTVNAVHSAASRTAPSTGLVATMLVLCFRLLWA